MNATSIFPAETGNLVDIRTCSELALEILLTTTPAACPRAGERRLPTRPVPACETCGGHDAERS